MLPRLRSFLTTLTQRQRFEDSLDEEMRFHLDAQTEDLVRTGMPPPEAGRRARAQFGNVEAMKHECRRVRGVWIVDELGRNMDNIRPVLRLLLKPQSGPWQSQRFCAGRPTVGPFGTVNVSAQTPAGPTQSVVFPPLQARRRPREPGLDSQ